MSLEMIGNRIGECKLEQIDKHYTIFLNRLDTVSHSRVQWLINLETAFLFADSLICLENILWSSSFVTVYSCGLGSTIFNFLISLPEDKSVAPHIS